MSFTFEQPFFADPQNRRELDGRLLKKGFQVERRGDELVVACSKEAAASTSAPTQVTIDGVKVEEFATAQPSQKKLHSQVVMGRHASVNYNKTPLNFAQLNREEEDQGVDKTDAAAPPKVPQLNLPRQATKVEMTDFLKMDPEKLRQQIHPRADAVSVRARAHARMLPSEIESIQDTACHICSKKFDWFRSPDKCGECNSLVCTKCSANLPYIEALVKQPASCVCIRCWNSVRAKLEVKAADESNTGRINTLIKEELHCGDSLLLDATQRCTAAEAQLNDKARESHTTPLTEAKKLTCKCCDRGFNLFRRPSFCGRCKTIVCAGAACIRVINEVLTGHAVSCCRECWPAARQELIEAAKKWPEDEDRIDVDVAIGDRFLIEAKSGKSLHLENAFTETMEKVEEKINLRRKALHQSKVHVSKSPRVNLNVRSNASSSSNNSELMPQISPRADIISPRAVAQSKFTLQEAKELTSKSVVCRRCQLSFTVFRAADKCGECDYSVCTKCSYTLPHMTELIGQDGCCCTECWDLVRTKLLTRGKVMPALSARCDKEVATGDRILYHPDRTTQAERVMTIRANEDAVKNPPIFKKTPEQLLERFVKKQKCTVCVRHFDMFRRPTICTRCHDVVCAGAACVRFVSSGEEHVACRSCWPEMHGDLERAAEEITDAAEYETVAVDIAFGDKFLLELQPGESIDLKLESAQALKSAEAMVARWRMAHNQPVHNELLPKEENSEEEQLLAVNVHEFKSAISPRAFVAEKFSLKEQRLCELGKLTCYRCKDRFDIFKAPERCTKCQYPVCTKCSFNFPHLQQLLPSMILDPCVCNECWDDIRPALKELESPIAKRELALGDEVLYTEPADRHVVCEGVIHDRWQSTKSNLLSTSEFGKTLHCARCEENFSIWKKPTVCSHCKGLVCTGLTCVKFVSLIHKAPVTCRDCWPRVRIDLLQVAAADPDLADDVDMERAVGDKLFLELKAGEKVSWDRVLKESTKVGQNSIATRQLGTSQTNIRVPNE